MKLKYVAKGIEFFHIFVALLYITSMFLIFLSSTYRFFSAAYMLFIGVVWSIYGGCPLTDLENKLLEVAGIKLKMREFIPRVSKKYFNLNVSKNLSKRIATLFFFISLFVIIFYFL